MSKREQQARQATFAQAALKQIAEQASLTPTTVRKVLAGEFSGGTVRGAPLRETVLNAAQDAGVNHAALAL